MMHSEFRNDSFASGERSGCRPLLPCVARLIAWRKRAVIRACVEAFDDHMLRDIGLSRSSLVATVVQHTQIPQGSIFR